MFHNFSCEIIACSSFLLDELIYYSTDRYAECLFLTISSAIILAFHLCRYLSLKLLFYTFYKFHPRLDRCCCNYYKFPNISILLLIFFISLYILHSDTCCLFNFNLLCRFLVVTDLRGALVSFSCWASNKFKLNHICCQRSMKLVDESLDALSYLKKGERTIFHNLFILYFFEFFNFNFWHNRTIRTRDRVLHMYIHLLTAKTCTYTNVQKMYICILPHMYIECNQS